MAAQHDPIHKWRERFARLVLKVDFKPLSDVPFHAATEPIFEGITRSRHSPGVTFRDEMLVKESNGDYGLVISQSKSLDITHRRRNLQLFRGSATLMHLCETGSVGSLDNVGIISVIVPDIEIIARCPGVSDAVIKGLPRHSEALQLRRGYIHTLKSPSSASLPKHTRLSAGTFLISSHLLLRRAAP